MGIKIARKIGDRILIREAAEDELLTTAEVMALVGCTQRWVYLLVQLGRLPAHRRGGRVLIPARAVLEYLERRQARSRITDRGFTR